tara:strand:+ start:1212 stop:1442 length:231 start_codon:yes stop_codon:yes gene_type:complete
MTSNSSSRWALNPKVESDGMCWLSIRVKVDPEFVETLERVRLSMIQESGLYNIRGNQVVLACLKTGLDSLKDNYDE